MKNFLASLAAASFLMTGVSMAAAKPTAKPAMHSHMATPKPHAKPKATAKPKVTKPKATATPKAMAKPKATHKP